MRPGLAERISGSADLFEHDGRRPWASINFISSHDGMTLEDVVSYSRKYNEPNGENSADGQSENYSSNWGHEGVHADARVRALRARIKRSMLMTLFASLGTPMLLGGDEFGRSQNGNNNAYCQDNEISWFDWRLLAADEGQELTAFVQQLAALRRVIPRADIFLHGKDQIAPGIADIEWFDERGVRLSQADWRNAEARALVVYLASRAANASAQVSALAMNASVTALDYRLLGNVRWRMLLDSAVPGRGETPLDQPLYRIEPHAAVLLAGMVTAEFD